MLAHLLPVAVAHAGVAKAHDEGRVGLELLELVLDVLGDLQHAHALLLRELLQVLHDLKSKERASGQSTLSYNENT